MSRFTRRILWALLVALSVALADGPFVDEVMAEESKQAQVQAPPGPSADEAGGAGGNLLVYDILLHASGPVSYANIDGATATHPLPAFGHLPLRSRFLAPDEKPPRSLA